MINQTSLKQSIVRNKIIKASMNVIHNGYSVDHVTNRNGRAYMAIRYNQGAISVTDRKGRDITKQVALSF